MSLSRRGIWWIGVLSIVGVMPGRLLAQGLDTVQVREAVELLHRRVNADPHLPRALQGRPFAELLGGLGFAQVLRLEDSELRVATKAFYETLLRLDPATCNRLTGGGGGSDHSTNVEVGSALFVTADSALLDRWAEVLVAMLRVKVDKTQPRPIATEAEGNDAMVELITKLPEDEQQRLMAGLESPDPDERCWSLRTFFRELSLLPAAELGPLARSIIQRR